MIFHRRTNSNIPDTSKLEKFSKRLSIVENLCGVYDGSKWGFANLEGELVIPCKYELVGSHVNGYAPFFENKKWGFLDTKGNIAIEPQFDSVSFFNDLGLAKVKNDGLWSAINARGTVIFSGKTKEQIDDLFNCIADTEEK